MPLIMNETIQAIINDITSTDDGPITAFVILSRGLALAQKAKAGHSLRFVHTFYGWAL